MTSTSPCRALPLTVLVVASTLAGLSLRSVQAAESKPIDAQKQTETTSEIQQSLGELKAALENLALRVGDQSSVEARQAIGWIRLKLSDLEQALNESKGQTQEQTAAMENKVRETAGSALKNLGVALEKIGTSLDRPSESSATVETPKATEDGHAAERQ